MVFESSSRNVIAIALVLLVASTALLAIEAVDHAALKAAAEVCLFFVVVLVSDNLVTHPT